MRHVVMLLLASCTGEITDDPDEMMPEPVVCEETRAYTGFGGKLGADRPAIDPGSDRMRMKPYAALAAEYARAFALPSFDTAQYAATFGRAPARWYAEAAASANTIYAAFALAYSACSQHTARQSVTFGDAPNPTSADRHCRDFARAAWQREATDEEAATCAAYAVDKTNPADAPAKRWAYACASVLTASNFLTY